MKGYYKLICLTAILGAFVLTTQIALAVDIPSLQLTGLRQCASMSSTLNAYIENLNKSDSYPGMATDKRIDVTALGTRYNCTVPNLKGSIKTAISSQRSSLETNCQNLSNASTLTDAYNAYNYITNFSATIMPILPQIDQTESYASGYDSANKMLIYAMTFKNQRSTNNAKPFEYVVTATATRDALADEYGFIWDVPGLTKDNIRQVVGKKAVGQNGNNYCQITNPSFLDLFAAPTKLALFKNNLSPKLKEVVKLNTVTYHDLTNAMYPIMVESAKLGHVLNSSNTDLQYYKDYDSLLAQYNKQRDTLRAAFDKALNSQSDFLYAYPSKLSSDSKKYSNLLPAVTAKFTTALDNNINILRSYRSGIDSMTASYSSAAAANKRLADLNIKGILIKNIDLAAAFNKSLLKAVDYKATCDNFTLTSAYNSGGLLYTGLNVAASPSRSSDLQTLSSLKASFDDVCAVVGSLNVGLNNAIQEKIQDNATKSSVYPTPTATLDDIKALAALEADYNSKLADVNSKIAGYRKTWWGLIQTAVINGNPAFMSKFKDSNLALEQQAEKTFETFNKKRNDYLSQAQKIITDRKTTLTKNKGLMDQAVTISGGIKDHLYSAVNTLLGTGTGSLDDYYNNTIAAANNYYDLVADVNAIKDFKLPEVIIPLQKSYLQIDSLYANDAAYFAVYNNLSSRYDALPAAQRTLKMSNLLADIRASLGIVWGNNDSGTMSKFKETMDQALTSLDTDAIKNLDTLRKPIAAELSSAFSNEKQLLALIVKAEKSK